MTFKRLPFRVLVPAALFAALVLVCNPHWFRVAMVENSDIAANSLQVFHARHFSELLGNYSRWEFHHPGPVFFYLFAAGELLFAGLLKVVPAPLNAQYVMLVLVNTALLFGAIEICAVHFRGALFRPLALAGAVLLIYNLNTGNSTGAMVSLWMPHVALLPFLFFTVACASVMAGRVSHLPLVALGAMTMVHLHVAQLLFAGVLMGMACTAAAVWTWRAHAFRRWRGAYLGSAAIVVLFLLPIVLELVLHKPNNLDDIRAYLQRNPDPSRGLAVASKYLLAFLFLSQDTSLRVLGPVDGLLEQAWHAPHVVIYWAMLAAGLAVSGVLAIRGGRSRFAGMLLAVGLVVALLFLYWANRITGDMYTFNGYFFFSIHLLALLWIAGSISAWQADREARMTRWVRALWAVPFLCMLPAAAEFRNAERGAPAVHEISRTLPSGPLVQLVFRHDDWDTAVGVANQLARRGQPFCIAANWGFMFGRQYVCPAAGAPRQIAITNAAWYELGRQPLPLPLVIEAGDFNARRDGFCPPEGDHEWSTATGVLTFTVQPNPASVFRLTVTGSVLPERPVEVALNGQILGMLDGIWKSNRSLPVPREALRWGEVNQLSFHTNRAGPIAGDARPLGFSLMQLRLEAVPGG
jgi:hypothetical protein